MENEQVGTFRDGVTYINWEILRKKRFAKNMCRRGRQIGPTT